MEIVKTTALITINETLWVQMVVFLIFLFLINRIMFRPVRRNLAEREAHFDALREDVRALKESMEALLRKTEAEENRLRTTAHRVADELRRESRRAALQMMADAVEDIKALRQDAEVQLQAAMEKTRQEIAPVSEALTAAIVHRLTREGLPK